MAEVGLFAMKRDQITRAILPLTVAGIEVDIVQMSPIALYNYISFDQLKGSSSKDSVVVLDIGADNTDLIITDGTRIWQRNVPIGGNHFTRALTKELKLTFAKAEHLKRNATKAPDPRAIFTAMRGVFNDFTSEVNRSIGFYSSINRSAKIRKVLGLGNGFKLPGLQKFLQQNLNQEIEKVDAFAKLAGDEVKAAPQFQDNMASFAVAYGLGIQGLGKGGLSTNLLPPEIERIRMIRAKKPWALASSALILLGLSTLFLLGPFRLLATVSTPQFKAAVDQANSVTKRGTAIKTALDSAKNQWKDKFDYGTALIIDPTYRALWPSFLKTISGFWPDPVAEYKLNPDDPANQATLEKLRVHIDLIKPVWRTDVAAGWFDTLDPKFKRLMHPYDVDAANAPTGEGWIVQIACHHYNPYPSAEQLRITNLKDPRRTEFGPYQFITEKVLHKLNSPFLRLYGVSHVALAWMSIDRDWTSEKGSGNNNLASSTVPVLDRASPPADTEAGAGGVSRMSRGVSGMGSGYAGGVGGKQHGRDDAKHDDGRQHDGRGRNGWRRQRRSQEEHQDSHADRLPHPVPLEAHSRRGIARRSRAAQGQARGASRQGQRDARENGASRGPEEQLGGHDSQRRGNREGLQAEDFGAGNGDHQGPAHACHPGSGRSGRCRGSSRCGASGRAGRPRGAHAAGRRASRR